MKKSFRFCLILLLIQQSFIKAQPCPLNVVPTSFSVCAGFDATVTAFGATSYTWTGITFTAPVFSQSIAVGPGTYTVTGNTHTCTSVITIGLQPPLNIQVSQSSATTCIASGLPVFSQPVTLMASGASVYTLYPSIPPVSFPSSITVRPIATTCYTVVGATAVCSGTAVGCVTVIPQFTIAVSPEVSSICKGESIKLTVSQVGTNAAGPASSYLYNWTDTGATLNTNNSQSVIASPSNGAAYTVTVLDAGLCLSVPATASISVSLCSVIPEHKNSKTTFFPNPFNDVLDINVTDAILVEITDALGKAVMTIKPGAGAIHSVDARLFLPGIYFATVTSSALQKSCVKLIKD